MGNNNNNNNNKNKYYQLEIAEAMDKYARDIKDGGEPSFVAALGDNFYKNVLIHHLYNHHHYNNHHHHYYYNHQGGI